MNGGGDEPAPDILELTKSMTAAKTERARRGREHAAGSGIPHDRRQFRYRFRRLCRKAPSRPIRDPTASIAFAPDQRGGDSAFNTLAQTVLVQNARTLEDLVREMLRPMLKTWLDENLPGIVERLVRAEIERVARGR